jgi:hypothetical protein
MMSASGRHLADLAPASVDVRCRGQSGHHSEASECLLLTPTGHAQPLLDNLLPMRSRTRHPDMKCPPG